MNKSQVLLTCSQCSLGLIHTFLQLCLTRTLPDKTSPGYLTWLSPHTYLFGKQSKAKGKVKTVSVTCLWRQQHNIHVPLAVSKSCYVRVILFAVATAIVHPIIYRKYITIISCLRWLSAEHSAEWTFDAFDEVKILRHYQVDSLASSLYIVGSAVTRCKRYSQQWPSAIK